MKLKFAVLAIVLILGMSCSKESTDDSIALSADNAFDVELQLLYIINDHREKMGQTALKHSNVAYSYANSHTDYMIQKGVLSHDNFNSRAASLSADTNAEEVAENVAKDYASATEAFMGWMSSDTHRSTMEDNFTHTAISVKKDSNGNLYYTQLFYR